MTRSVIGDFEGATLAASGWTGADENGSATVDAAALKRGAKGLLTTCSDDGYAYAYRDPGVVPAAGAAITLGWWFNKASSTGDYPYILKSRVDSSDKIRLRADYESANQPWTLSVIDDEGAPGGSDTGGNCSLAGWHWYALGISRATEEFAEDGAVALAVDGAQVATVTGVLNYTSTGGLNNLLLGAMPLFGNLTFGQTFYFDDVCITDGLILAAPPWEGAGNRSRMGYGR